MGRLSILPIRAGRAASGATIHIAEPNQSATTAIRTVVDTHLTTSLGGRAPNLLSSSSIQQKTGMNLRDSSFHIRIFQISLEVQEIESEDSDLMSQFTELR